MNIQDIQQKVERGTFLNTELFISIGLLGNSSYLLHNLHLRKVYKSSTRKLNSHTVQNKGCSPRIQLENCTLSFKLLLKRVQYTLNFHTEPFLSHF